VNVEEALVEIVVSHNRPEQPAAADGYLFDFFEARDYAPWQQRAERAGELFASQKFELRANCDGILYFQRGTGMDGKPAEGVLRLNSEYPKDGFWWDSQLRITPAFPAGVHFLEPYAGAVADLDACRITRGGLFLDKAHTEEIARFARAYRSLPCRKFDAVGKTTDPVVVRTLVSDNMRYVYAVNRECYPVEVKVEFGAEPKGLRDLASGESLAASQTWTLPLGPYELRSFGLAPEIAVSGFSVAVPAEMIRTLTDEAGTAFQAFAKVRAAGRFIPGMEEIETGMRAALVEGRFAWLRRALTSYCVRTCREA